ncbi:uncharacterized protein [Rutidosis leptorrhynchoides]|uniref:uncharacterized protein n=1 Tax=Rutidosis leptorrhynchoides TaxID=125765 RepID=UPI003A98E83C
MDRCEKLNEPSHKELVYDDRVLLQMNSKIICKVKCSVKSIARPLVWDIETFMRKENVPTGLTCTKIYPAYEDDTRQKKEWRKFMRFLDDNKKAALVNTKTGQMYILPASLDKDYSHAVVQYLLHEHSVIRSQSHVKSDDSKSHVLLTKDTKSICRVKCDEKSISKPLVWDIEQFLKKEHVPTGLTCTKIYPDYQDTHQKKEWNKFMRFLDENKKAALANTKTGQMYILPASLDKDYSHAMVQYLLHEASVTRSQSHVKSGSPVPQSGLKKNSVHPSFLKTLGQTHADWIFGAVAELVDNSKDANATMLDISIEMIYFKAAKREIPMLAVKDDGHGMSHEDLLRMVTFGRKQPDTNNPDIIGRYGVGFKTGTMRLGRDALVLTQTTSSRSIARLSQSLNEENDYVEIPTVTYSIKGQYMELDTNIQTEASAKYNLKAIMDNSPFNEFLIGELSSFFKKTGTGTQIFVWNLDRRGSEYTLEWVNGLEGDILIRSRRARSRLGQMTRSQVRLDYSLQSFLEVIFLDPRMRIYVQGSLVKSKPIYKCLHKTSIENGEIMGKPVQLVLGQSQTDLELGNCGIFLFWHGRLIEAYKRVGTMVYNGPQSHGVIGVIDVTNIMDDDSGQVWVHNNKQRFVDCEAYDLLVDWLSEKADDYLDARVDKVYLEKGGPRYKPDRDWVQCDKCRKWRMLPSEFDIKTLSQEWFCYLKPFNGKCDIEEEQVEQGVITIASQRTRYCGAEKDPNKDTNADKT